MGNISIYSFKRNKIKDYYQRKKYAWDEHKEMAFKLEQNETN